MKIIFLLIQIASNQPVTLEAHPDCNPDMFHEAEYIQTNNPKLLCINANSVFRDVIYRNGFDD